MSKFLRIPNGDYTIETRDSGTITLDTGPNGEVVVTGDIDIRGDTILQELQIEDNIVLLNQGETGSSVTDVISGFQVDRGFGIDVFMLYDESAPWLNPLTELQDTGSFILRNDTGNLIGLTTSTISTQGGNLYLINDGTGVITVTGTTNYEEQVFVYSGGTNTGTAIDDDIIPNVRAMIDFVNLSQASFSIQDKIESFDTRVIVSDFQDTSTPSNIDFVIDGDSVLTIDANGISGVLRVDDIIEIEKIGTIPDAPSSGTRIFYDTPAGGDTGIYFVNDTDNQDELVSNDKALLYSLVL